MTATANLNGAPVFGAALDDAGWRELKRLSGHGLLHMPGTSAPALPKTRHGPWGRTRYFSHWPGQGDHSVTARRESPLHLSTKLAITATLHAAGIPATLEHGLDDWRADVWIPPRPHMGLPGVAVEVQMHPQSMETTLERTRVRAASGVNTVWVARVHQGQMTAALPPIAHHMAPVLHLANADAATQVAQKVVAFAQGQLHYDDPAVLGSVPVRALGARVWCRCGCVWLRPVGMVVLGNRICGDLKPCYLPADTAPVFWTTGASSTYNRLDAIDAVFAAEGVRYGIPVGTPSVTKLAPARTAAADYGALVQRAFACPGCQRWSSPPLSGCDPRAWMCAPTPVAHLGYAAFDLYTARTGGWSSTTTPPWSEPTMSVGLWATTHLPQIRRTVFLGLQQRIPTPSW